ncbi:hypothetical protein [Lentimicrobium sp. S6]|uniref:hypothetical protein n=1 Tax=Lentimicrobium sp. S6 TaxID=2735872 RepID=UPI001556F908|nr:hypothetical protein [Lentimicrobium sp. S6]NPD47491.1 hypothetical protein [Lentimicrobium sp. S6]
MLSILLKFKKPIIIAVLLLTGVVIFWYYSKRKVITADVPNDNPNNEPTQIELDQANLIARSLYSSFDNYGIMNFWYRPMDPFEDFAAVSDKVFVLSYNRFNQLYGMSGNGTLREWFNNDAFSSNDWEYIENTLFPRMDRLNLT